MNRCAWLLLAAFVMTSASCVTMSTNLNTDRFDWQKVKQSEDCQWWFLTPVFPLQDRAMLLKAVENMRLDSSTDFRLVGHEDVLTWYLLVGKTCINAWAVPVDTAGG